MKQLNITPQQKPVTQSVTPPWRMRLKPAVPDAKATIAATVAAQKMLRHSVRSKPGAVSTKRVIGPPMLHISVQAIKM